MAYYDIDWSQKFDFGHPRPLSSIRGSCLHTSEGNVWNMSATHLAAYQARTRTGSYHAVVDMAGTVLRENTADWHTWSTGNRGNEILLHLCFVARSEWSRDEWLKQTRMLRAGARVIAYWHERFGLPVEWVDCWSLPGVTTHDATRRAWGNTTHTDPGDQFPHDVFLQMVRDVMDGESQVSDEQEVVMNGEQNQVLHEIKGQLTGSQVAGDFPGWPQLGGRTVVDALAVIGQKLGVDGFDDVKDQEAQS